MNALFDLSGPCPVEDVADLLRARHYRGPTKTAKFAWSDADGALVFGSPRGRNVPAGWLELIRWCIIGGPNAGTQQWARVSAELRGDPDLTTVVSYSDPAQGHTGALYRACNWLWAPTWHRLRPPPTGNGAWKAGEQQAVKDRWIYPLRPDPDRAAALAVKDEAIMRRNPEWQYREPRWRRGRFDPRTGGGDYASFARTL